ncbi:uncharacterized protein NPIL_233291 [Nephila pilipes]|uniref:Gustatory receptor n=1 Tax=Nephila pilipes TaxID=299642 RepID=A0A8X6NQJ2_NEPPI|nr:uncharacterized protein NPIL_233291 [Nephila pilipes]
MLTVSRNKKIVMFYSKKCRQSRLGKKVKTHSSPKNCATKVRNKFGVEVHNSSNSSMLSEYLLLFGLLRLMGIKVVEHAHSEIGNNFEEHKITSVKQRVLDCSENCLKYFTSGIVYSRTLIAILRVIFLKNTTVSLIRLFQSVLFTLFYLVAYRKRQTMLQIAKDAECVYQQLPKCIRKYKKYSFKGVLAFVMVLLAIRMVLYRSIPKNNEKFQKQMYEFFLATDAHHACSYYFILLIAILELVSYIEGCVVLSIFTVYYSVTCSFIQDVFKYLLNQVDGGDSSIESKKLHCIYESIMKTLNDMDSGFSFLALNTVLICTGGLFWDGYSIAFYKNATGGFLIFTLNSIFYLVLQLMLMISASFSNELANKTKINMQCLPYEADENPEKMNFFKKTLIQENGLTLWKIYVMDRSLVVGIFGTLLTYGILLGTLEKNN